MVPGVAPINPNCSPNRSPIRNARRASEDGYILLGVLILLALFVIGLAVAAPRIAYDVQRDREIETMHRGKQYIRAIQLYYRKFNAYPPSVDALVKTNELRFLRKRYIDPITGKDDWKPVMYCQNKAPIAMGLFGAPLSLASGCGPLAGTGPSGGNGMQGGSIFGGDGSATGGIGTTGTSPTGTSPMGSIFSSPTAPAGGTPGSTDGSTTAAGATGAGAAGTATTGLTDANGNPASADNGQTLGGGGIVGVSPASEKKSILVYKKKKKYNEWEFTYGPEMETAGGVAGGNAGTIGQPVTGPGTGTTGLPGTGTGVNGGITPISPTPTQPQQ